MSSIKSRNTKVICEDCGATFIIKNFTPAPNGQWVGNCFECGHDKLIVIKSLELEQVQDEN